MPDCAMLDAPSTIQQCYEATAAPGPLPDLVQSADVPTFEIFFTKLAENMKAGVIKSTVGLILPNGLQLSLTLNPLRPTVNPPPTSTFAPPSTRASSWAGKVGEPTAVRPPRQFTAPTPSSTPRKPPVLPFATVINKGRHENMLTNIAAEGADRKTIDVRSFGHRLGGSDGPLLRNATAGTILSGTASRLSLDVVITGDVIVFESVAELQAACIRGELGDDACALPESWLGPEDAYVIRADGRKFFTPEAAQAFYDRNYPSRSGTRTDVRVLAVPVAPAPDAQLHRTRGATSGSAASMAHRDSRNRPATDGKPPPVTPKKPVAAAAIAPRALFTEVEPSELAEFSALDAHADCKAAIGATVRQHTLDRAAGSDTLPAHVKLAGKRAASRSPEDQPAAVTGAALAARQPRATRLTPAATSVPVTVVPVTSAPPPSAAPMETVPTVEESTPTAEESDDEASYDCFDGEMRIDASNGQPYTFDDFVDFYGEKAVARWDLSLTAEPASHGTSPRSSSPPPRHEPPPLPESPKKKKLSPTRHGLEAATEADPAAATAPAAPLPPTPPEPEVEPMEAAPTVEESDDEIDAAEAPVDGKRDATVDSVRHRRDASRATASPPRSPGKDKTPDGPVERASARLSTAAKAAARAAQSVARLAASPIGLAAGVSASSVNAMGAFTSLMTALPALVLFLALMAVIAALFGAAPSRRRSGRGHTLVSARAPPTVQRRLNQHAGSVIRDWSGDCTTDRS